MSTRFITEQLYEELRRRRYLENSQMDVSHVHSGSLPRVGSLIVFGFPFTLSVYFIIDRFTCDIECD